MERSKLNRQFLRSYAGAIASCAVITLAILAAEWFTHRGVANGAAYVIVVLESLRARNATITWTFTALCTALIVVGFFVSPHSEVPVLMAVVNRALSIFLIWVTAVLGMRLETANRQLHEHKTALEKTSRQLREQQAALQEANDRLERMAFVDGLTGIPNRRRFDDQLLAESRRAARERTALSVLMIDVDFFKAYNDVRGHQAGDQLLVSIAKSIAGQLRRSGDMVARYGGEEFAAILPATDHSAAMQHAEWIRQAVGTSATADVVRANEARVTVSVGVATHEQSREVIDPATLLAAADKVLYQAKQEGRNCVRGIVV